jgi:hypothetical protein
MAVATSACSATPSHQGAHNTGNTGHSGNTGNTGHSGNTGNTGHSGNTGNTGDRGSGGVVYWPDGTPARGVQIAFLPNSDNSEGLDPPTDFWAGNNGSYSAPSWPSESLFPEAWLVVMPTSANISELSNSWPTYANGCFLPLSNSPNPTSWHDIQISGFGDLYIANSACEETNTWPSGLDNWSGSSNPSAPMTSDIESMINNQQLDETTPFSWAGCNC